MLLRYIKRSIGYPELIKGLLVLSTKVFFLRSGSTKELYKIDNDYYVSLGDSLY